MKPSFSQVSALVEQALLWCRTQDLPTVWDAQGFRLEIERLAQDALVSMEFLEGCRILLCLQARFPIAAAARPDLRLLASYLDWRPLLGTIDILPCEGFWRWRCELHPVRAGDLGTLLDEVIPLGLERFASFEHLVLEVEIEHERRAEVEQILSRIDGSSMQGNDPPCESIQDDFLRSLLEER